MKNLIMGRFLTINKLNSYLGAAVSVVAIMGTVVGCLFFFASNSRVDAVEDKIDDAKDAAVQTHRLICLKDSEEILKKGLGQYCIEGAK